MIPTEIKFTQRVDVNKKNIGNNITRAWQKGLRERTRAGTVLLVPRKIGKKPISQIFNRIANYIMLLVLLSYMNCSLEQ